jgi:hypothetical protein
VKATETNTLASEQMATLKWGLSKPDELPYVTGLVRPAFEQQIGDVEAKA